MRATARRGRQHHQQGRAEHEQPGAVAQHAGAGHDGGHRAERAGGDPGQHGEDPAHRPQHGQRGDEVPPARVARVVRLPARLGSGPAEPPQPGRGEGEEHQEPDERTGTVPARGHHLRVPHPAQGQRRERPRQPTLAGQREDGGAGLVGGGRPRVQQAGDQPGGLGRQQQRPGGQRGPPARPEHDEHGQRGGQPGAHAQAAQRHQDQQPPRTPTVRAPPARAEHQPLEHCVPHEHRPVAQHQPLGDQRVPLPEGDSGQPGGEAEPRRGAQQPVEPQAAADERAQQHRLLQQHRRHDLVEHRDHRVAGHGPRQPAAHAEHVGAQHQVGHPHHVVGQDVAGGQRGTQQEQREGQRPQRHDDPRPARRRRGGLGGWHAPSGPRPTLRG